jgi:hypothetical protein
MRKKMLFLTLALAATAASFSTSGAVARPAGQSCTFCITYSDGSQCCRGCVCDGNGVPIACTNVYCPPEDGGGLE